MPRQALLIALATTLLLPAAGCTRPRGGGGGGGGAGPGSSGPLVQGLAIEGLALYQGVRVDILDGGDVVLDDAPVPIISGRPAMLRVFVGADGDWDSRDVEAIVELDLDGDTERFSATQSISGDSNDSSLNGTLNIDLPTEAMTGDTRLVSVKLIEVEDEFEASGSSNGAEWSASGDGLDLDARSTGEPLRIVIVPIVYNGDGSGRLPETGATQLGIFRDAMMAQYPTRDVEIVVEDSYTINWQIAASGYGWGETLEQLSYLRDDRGGAFDEYWYGLFSPASSFANYCGGNCVAGLSWLAESPNDSWARVSMGLGFPGEDAAATMVHEVGHAHGREHAPCGVSGAGYYPHSGASIGVQGYDIITGQLKNVSSFTDFMGYCDPTWVSDYTFNWLYDRIRDISGARQIVPPPGFSPRWSSARVQADGTLVPGRVRTLELPPTGKEARIEQLDAQGRVVAVVTASFHPYSHLDGGLLLYPEPPPDVVAVRLQDAANATLQE